MAPTWQRRNDVLWRRSLDSVIVFGADGGEPLTLAGTGPAVWALLEGPITLAALSEQLAERFNTSIETVKDDVSSLLRHLEEAGAIDSHPGEGCGELITAQPQTGR